MADLDLYSELVEEEVALDDLTTITDSVRNYILSLQAQKTALETEIEALSTQVNRLEVERSQNLAVRDQIIHNFWLLALVCRREIFKFKQRIQFLSAKACVPEPTYTIATTSTETSQLNPENPLNYTEIRNYLHSFQTPDKSQLNSLATTPRPRNSPTEPVSRPDGIQVAQSIGDAQPQQELVCSRQRRSSSASTSSSGSSSSGSSSGSSSSSSSDSSSANSRSVSRCSNRSSQPIPAPASHVLARTCLPALNTRPDRKPESRQSIPNGRISSHATRRIPSPTHLTTTGRYNSPRSSRSPPSRKRPKSRDKSRTQPVRSAYDRTRPQSGSIRRPDRDRITTTNVPPVKSNLSRSLIEQRAGAREPPRSTHSNTSCYARDRKRPVEHLETKPHVRRAEVRHKELRSPSPKRRIIIKRSGALSSERELVRSVAMEPQDLQKLKDSTADRAVPRQRTNSGDQSMDRIDHNQSVSPGGAIDQSAEAPLIHPRSASSKTPEKELVTLYTKRLRSRLEDSHAAPSSAKAIIETGQSVECDVQLPLPMTASTTDGETHSDRERPPNISPARDSNLLNEHITDSPSTLPDRVPEPLLETSVSPVLSEPIPVILSTSPILEHSYVDEPVIEHPVARARQQPTPGKQARPSSTANSNDNWSSFDEEGGFDTLTDNQPTELADNTVDHRTLESLEYDEHDDEAREEGEIGDELEDEEDDRGCSAGVGAGRSPYSSVDTERRSSVRHQVQHSWSRSPHRHISSTHRNSGSRTRVSTSRSPPPDRRASTRHLAAQPVENHTSRRQTSAGVNGGSVSRASDSPHRHAASAGWKSSGCSNRAGHSGMYAMRRSRSPSPITFHSKSNNLRYRSPTGPRSPTRSSHKPASQTRTNRDISAERRSASIRDRNRSPSQREPFPSGPSRRSSDPLRSDPTHSDRHSLPCAHRSDRHSHVHNSPPRSKPRFDRERDRPSTRGRRMMAPSKLHPYSRTPSNLRHPPPRLVGTGARLGARRF